MNGIAITVAALLMVLVIPEILSILLLEISLRLPVRFRGWFLSAYTGKSKEESELYISKRIRKRSSGRSF